MHTTLTFARCLPRCARKWACRRIRIGPTWQATSSSDGWTRVWEAWPRVGNELSDPAPATLLGRRARRRTDSTGAARVPLEFARRGPLRRELGRRQYIGEMA